MRVLNFDSFIRNWHAQHLTVIVLVFTFTLLSSLLNAVFPNPKSTARYVFLLLLIAVFVQSQPLEAFTARFHHPTSYRIMGDVLSSRVSAKDRVLVAPYLVLDFRYQTLTPPSYLSKEYVDHIFEYTSDLPLRIQIQKHGIRYFVDAKQLIHNNADDQVGVKSNLGRVYDIDPNEYSLEIEYARMKEYLREVNAVMIFSSDKIDIYDLKSGT
ncbi:MAG: hypothetical protein KKF77_06085 [Proteobacteria bacterium]|nr:hypothetical protein [Pseudomonadota bacterium]